MPELRNPAAGTFLPLLRAADKNFLRFSGSYASCWKIDHLFTHHAAAVVKQLTWTTWAAASLYAAAPVHFPSIACFVAACQRRTSSNRGEQDADGGCPASIRRGRRSSCETLTA
jgi:hypothetical protein